jgi:hypothetical protein
MPGSTSKSWGVRPARLERPQRSSRMRDGSSPMRERSSLIPDREDRPVARPGLSCHAEADRQP